MSHNKHKSSKRQQKKSGRRSHKNRTEHHIIPSSRLDGKGILNVCKVDGKIHDLSHQIFGNMTPKEIVAWLNITLWNSQYRIEMRRW